MIPPRPLSVYLLGTSDLLFFVTLDMCTTIKARVLCSPPSPPSPRTLFRVTTDRRLKLYGT